MDVLDIKIYMLVYPQFKKYEKYFFDHYKFEYPRECSDHSLNIKIP